MSDTVERLKAALSDRYTVDHELGAGGMATVYLAEDLRHHRKVAIKVLRPELAAILGAERFLKEIEVTANLQHPHILSLHDSGEADSFLYYVMPYVEGESLRERLNRERQLGVDETVEIAKSVAAALDYAHRQGVIHRDIKPENILIHDGQPVVADFGIALAVTSAGGTRLTETGLSLGTPHYMSPEQAVGEREITAKSDVYSLGAVVYEMLAGDPPHSGSTAQAIIAKVVSVEPQPVSDGRPAVPTNVQAAVHKALAKVPADRFARAAEFATALNNPTFTAPAIIAPIGATRPASGWTRRTVGVAGLAAVMLVAATVLVMWFLFWPSPQGPEPVTRFDLIFPDGNGPDATFSQLAISPDGRSIVYHGADSTNTRRLFLRKFDRQDVTPIPGSEGADRPFFSPDGQALGFLRRGRVLTMPIGGGVPIDLGPGGAGSWGPQSTIVHERGGGLVRVGAEGGEPTLIAAPADSSDRYVTPHVLPDGRTILFVMNPGRRLAAMSLDGSGVQELGQEGAQPMYVEDGVVVFRRDRILFAAPFDARALRLTGSPQPLAENVGFWGVSRTGTLAFVYPAPMRLVAVDRLGRQELIPQVPSGSYLFPRYSPDGQHLLVQKIELGGERDIWRYGTARGTWAKVTDNSTSGWPEWAPDGQHMIYNNVDELYWAAADGSGTPTLLLARPDKYIWQGFLTPDDRTLVFWECCPQDIWLNELADPDEVFPLARTRFNEHSIALAPDGTWFAYQSNETGEFEIYARRIRDGEDGRVIPVSLGGGVEPRWSRNGQELFYRSGDSLMVVPMEIIGPGLHVGTARALFADPYLRGYNAYYDVHPSNQEFVFISARLDIRVEVNALDEMRSRR